MQCRACWHRCHGGEDELSSSGTLYTFAASDALIERGGASPNDAVQLDTRHADRATSTGSRGREGGDE